MGEFSDDDDDFASFDLDSAVSAARRSSAGGPCGTDGGGTAPAFRDPNHPNLGGGPSANDGRKPPADAVAGGSAPKRPRTDGHPGPAADDDAEGGIPVPFRQEMEGTLMAHFGHGTFRPGQLSVLHSLLGQGAGRDGRDACVFWATG